jgi:ABC-type sugar transport system permease subunit
MEKPSALSKIKKASSLEKANRAGLFFVLPFLIIFAIFNLYPVLHSLRLSFYSWDGISPMKPVGFANYVRLVTADPYFFKSIGNTLYLLILYLPLTVLLALLLASLLNNKIVPKKHFFQTAWFLPYIVAPVSIGLLFRVLFDWSTGAVNGILVKIGLLHEGLNWLGDPKLTPLVLAILLIWSDLGYVTTLFLAGMTNISSEILEAAEVDGANYLQTLFKIIVPLLKPVIVFVTITGTIACLQLYDAANILVNPGMMAGTVGGPGRSVLTGIWYMVDTSRGGSTGRPEMGYAAAITYGLFFVTALFSILNFKLISSKEENYE